MNKVVLAGIVDLVLSSVPTEMLKTRSDATNRFFEARVAVMGFKCRTMQLQGELDEMVKPFTSHVHVASSHNYH